MRLGSAALLLLFASGSEAANVHSERSLYQNILVTEVGSMRCLQFSVRRDQRNQSCVDTRAPDRLALPYSRMMLAGLLLNPAPERIYIAGLGGGSLTTALAHLYPDAAIDVVEIDPAVVRVAAKFFDFTPSARTRVFEQDARAWGRRALRAGDRYDLILLDAFNGDYIPEHLMTREYLEETRALLTDDGVLVANTFAVSALYDHESATYAAVFGTFFNLTMPDSANRVILTGPGTLPAREVLVANAKQLAPKLSRLGVQIEAYPRRLSTKRTWKADARVLTDQYSPANLLREQPAR
jgi:spermidine synthase